MGVVNYPGDLSVAVVLQFRGDTVPSAMAIASDQQYRYLIANESVTELEVRGRLGGATYRIARRSGPGRRLFDDNLNTFLSGPVSGADIDALLDGSPTYVVDLKFTYATFFDVLMQEMCADASARHNPANPADSARLLDTFTRSESGGRVSITYRSATEQITNVPATLVDHEVTPGASGRPPAVKLVFELDFLTGINDAKRDMMRKLLAMDWTKLARLGRPVDDPPVYVDVWQRNMLVWMVNHTNLERGRQIRDQIKDAHKTKTAQQLATDLRNDIDAWIVTANHWGEARESLRTERHQRLLSDLFGTIHQTAFLGSPVSFIRTIDDVMTLSLADKVALIFTWGAGHCGEHATCSFYLLKTIIDETSAREVSHVIYTGNANIDHAFVVYNLDVSEVILTKTTAANNSRRPTVGSDIAVWNLRQTIADNAPRPGFVLDPYLDPSVMRSTAEELLTALNNQRRRQSNKHTDFLAFTGEHPSSVNVTDIRGESVATRRARVPNV